MQTQKKETKIEKHAEKKESAGYRIEHHSAPEKKTCHK